MNKVLFFFAFSILTVSSFAIEQQNTRIFIEGTATRLDHLDYFLENFRSEAIGTNILMANNRGEAGFIFSFNVYPVDAAESEYIIEIRLLRGEDNQLILFFDFSFGDIDEMFIYNQFLFFRATNSIPRTREEPVDDNRVKREDLGEAPSKDNNNWRSRRLYVRASLDYPVTFYALRADGLIEGVAAYNPHPDWDPDNDPEIIYNSLVPLDNKIIALPGLTVGAEFRFLSFMSAEVNFEIFMGTPGNNLFINMAAGAELKFLFNAGGFMIQPYAAVSVPINVSPDFAEFPFYAAGGGIQISVRGFNAGAFFLDLRALFSFSDAGRHNPFGSIAPYPEVICYRHSIAGIGIGYKHGFF